MEQPTHCQLLPSATVSLRVWLWQSRGLESYLGWARRRRAGLCVRHETLELVVLVGRGRRQAAPENACIRSAKLQGCRLVMRGCDRPHPIRAIANEHTKQRISTGETSVRLWIWWAHALALHWHSGCCHTKR